MISFITFSLSFLLIVLMLWNKSRELSTGKAFVCLSYDCDSVIVEKWGKLKSEGKHMPKALLKTIIFLFAHYALDFFDKIKKFIYPRVAHIVERVRGKDVPKHKGPVSLFLLHINEVKKEEGKEEKKEESHL